MMFSCSLPEFPVRVRSASGQSASLPLPWATYSIFAFFILAALHFYDLSLYPTSSYPCCAFSFRPSQALLSEQLYPHRSLLSFVPFSASTLSCLASSSPFASSLQPLILDHYRGVSFSHFSPICTALPKPYIEPFNPVMPFASCSNLWRELVRTHHAGKPKR